MNLEIKYKKENDVHFVEKIIYFMYFIFFIQFSVMLYDIYYKIPDGILYKEEDSDEDEDEEDEEDEEKKPEKKVELPYEKKYLDKLLSLGIKKWTEDDLDHLQNTYVIEKTPVGNVLMYWNNKKKSFTYYADATIPYRYLEVVSRKYVVMNNCREIYIIKREKEEKEEKDKKEEKEEKDKKDNDREKDKKDEKDVNVFAKLKKYNQTSIHMVKAMNPSSSSSSLPPPPMSITALKKNNSTENIDNEEIFNRYLCDGRIANFSFLKREKKEGRQITFSEFKKMKSS